MKKLIALLMAAGLTMSAQATEVHFSPKGGAEAAVVREINAAQHSLFVATYQLTNKRIADALIEAWKRGVTVKVIVDKSQRPRAPGGCCAPNVAAVMPVLVDSKHPIMHDKVVVIDQETVITGSFNFSNAAEKSNAENLLVIHDKDLAKQYIDNWQLHANHSEGF